MSDATIAVIVSGVLSVLTMVTGFLGMIVKLHFARVATERATKEAAEKVEAELKRTTAREAARVKNVMLKRLKALEKRLQNGTKNGGGARRCDPLGGRGAVLFGGYANGGRNDA